jgi:peptide/nickel transport system permease protein
LGRYIGRRAITGAFTVAVVLVLNFFLIHFAPGDPITILAGTDNPSQELIDITKAKYGLDKPVIVQLWTYIKTLLKGDLGYSIIYGRSVAALIKERLGNTLLLTFTSAILALLIGTSLGLIAARRSGSALDNGISVIAYVLYAMPSFWLGLMMMLLFATGLGLLPTSGMVDSRASYTGIKYVLDVLKHMALPVGTLTLVGVPTYFRITKASLAQVMKDDYITLFRATGMDEKRIFQKYSFRNAILPTITTFGIRLAYVMTGATTTEIVFAWPGMGRLVMSAINTRDYPVLMGTYLIMSISVAVCMILVDVLYAVADPRIRYD